MKPFKRTVFNDDWLIRPEFFGIRRALNGNDTEAYCNLCKRVITLSNMGVEALKSHDKLGSNHDKKRLAAGTSGNMRLYTSKASDSVASSKSPDIREGVTPMLFQTRHHRSRLIRRKRQLVPRAPHRIHPIGRVQKYFHSEDVSKAEIMWTLQTVVNHASMSASAKQVELFPVMFSDSKIASDMRLGRTKLSYGLVYGLAPHFHSNLTAAVRTGGVFVVSFDESLNKVSQAQQMDIAISFWNNATNQVGFHYSSSAFLGHSRASDMLKAFLEELLDFDLRNLLQLAMDGPNVNLAFSRELEKFIHSTFGNHISVFMNMDSCGLHVVHNSFKQAVKGSNWAVISFLKSSYFLFKDVPARRSDHLRFHETTDDSEVPDKSDGNDKPGAHEEKPAFPMKFCAHRWLENEPAIDRGIKTLPNVRKFVDGVSREKTKIISKSFLTVEKCLQDPLLAAKLAFVGFVAKQITTFLRDYQCEAPMAPFLYSDLTAIIRDLMKLFVKDSVLENANSVCDVDLKDDKNLLDSKRINCGFAVKAELRKVAIADDKVEQFKSECRGVNTSAN